MRYTEMLMCRVSSEQKKLILKDIEENYPDLSLSEYYRNKVLGKPMNAREVIILLSELKYEINRIGNNLNQIAHKINSGNYGWGDISKIDDMKKEIMQLNDSLMDIETKLMKSGKD